MSKIESVLKSEISRLAKREVNAAYRPLAGEVREMKKKLQRETKFISFPFHRNGAEMPLDYWGKEVLAVLRG